MAPLNEALVGKRYPEVRFEVDAERARAFAAAVGAWEGFVPPTFATAPEVAGLAQVIDDPELGLDLSRVVHGEQSYEWRRPLRVGDILRCRPRIEAVRSKGGTGFLTVTSEIVDARGQLVVVARCTLVELGAR
ncbi:MAG TPA: MaoC family dehydratase N-terminal domain-containing protein [Actinomycetota bacterium]|nr:MaoC family dehydratase N-terminal domain-containing protein [Actinomycetota bacterium]